MLRPCSKSFHLEYEKEDMKKFDTCSTRAELAAAIEPISQGTTLEEFCSLIKAATRLGVPVAAIAEACEVSQSRVKNTWKTGRNAPRSANRKVLVPLIQKLLLDTYVRPVHEPLTVP